MAYREKVFNANVLTDLLSTYLTHKAQEREKYYDAEIKASKPIYRTVNKDLYQINPRTGESSLLIEGERTKKEPDFEDFPQVDKDGNPTGMSIKGMFTGTDKPFTGVPLGYEPVGKKPQFKPEAPNRRAEEIENKDIARMVADRKELIKRKNRNYDIEDLILIEKGIIPKDFTEEDQTRLDSIERKLSEKGFDFNVKEIEDNSSSELIENLNTELSTPMGEAFTEKHAKYYYSDKGKSDIQKMTKEFEEKYPPGTYDPYEADLKRAVFWSKLQRKYMGNDPSGLPSLVGRAFTNKYNANIVKYYGRDGTISNPVEKLKSQLLKTRQEVTKGSFWE
tara:strand:+ start:144 stop:1148 length:1005 start_codon:yes stop_codon:yes gene_type:complete